jgi:hypothetical protein
MIMGVHNLKFETEVFQFQPNFQITGGITPVETKPDPSWLSQIATQISQLTQVVGQLHQTVVAQTFTRAAPAIAGEAVNTADELRKLNQRLDDLEGRIGKP